MNDMNYGIGQSKFGALWVRSYSTITPYERIACHNKNFSVPSGPEEFYSEQKKCTQYLGIKTTTPNTNQNQKWQQQQNAAQAKKLSVTNFRSFHLHINWLPVGRSAQTASFSCR